MWLYPEVRTLGELVEYYARHDPERLAIREGDRNVSFRELNGIANRVARGLIAGGLEPGARVGYLGPNAADFFFALFGTAKTRAAFCVFNWRLSVPELAELVRDSGVRTVIVDRDMAGLWGEACKQAGRSLETIWLEEGAGIAEHFADQPDDRLSVEISEDDCAVQLYTSGTTGLPKGVMLSHGGFNRMRLCEHLESAFDWQDNDVFLNALPNFHLLGVGISLQCLYNGVAVSLVRQFEPVAVLEAVGRDRPTLLTLAPAMIQMLLDHPKAESTDFSSVRLTLYAGSPISLGLIQRAIERMPGKFMQFYGATETGGAASLLRPEEHDLGDEAKLESCGRPLPLVEFRIVDDRGTEVLDGEPGELITRAPGVTAGYWQKPEVTSEALKHGWYYTGDIARRDAEGLYYIVGRKKDMIVSGGENIYAAEIENCLSLHPEVSSVAVIGVPDKRWGEAVKAMVVPKVAGKADADALIAWCRERIASYKVPKSVDFLAELPLGTTGKVSKKDLRAPFWKHHERSIG